MTCLECYSEGKKIKKNGQELFLALAQMLLSFSIFRLLSGYF
jgi:hypothetical protein